VDTDFYRQSSVALDAEEDGQWIGAWVRSYWILNEVNSNITPK
jgi:hypothetical protein